MTVPKELIATTDDTSEKNAKLDQLLSKFEVEYVQDPEYNFIQKLQQERDKAASLRSESIKSEIADESQKNIF